MINALLRQFWVTCLICVMNPELTYDSTIGTLQHHMHLDAHKPAKPDSMMSTCICRVRTDTFEV